MNKKRDLLLGGIVLLVIIALLATHFLLSTGDTAIVIEDSAGKKLAAQTTVTDNGENVDVAIALPPKTDKISGMVISNLEKGQKVHAQIDDPKQKFLPELTEGAKVTNIRTKVAAVNPLEFESATLKLAKLNGPMNTIARCDDWNFNSFECSGDWEATNIQYSEYDTHVEFNVEHFSAYAGIYLGTKGDTCVDLSNSSTYNYTAGYPVVVNNSGMYSINESVLLCPGTYVVENNNTVFINLTGNDANSVFDCDGAYINGQRDDWDYSSLKTGDGQPTGINVFEGYGAVQNCMIYYFITGISLSTASNTNLTNVTLEGYGAGNSGISLSSGNFTLNNVDVWGYTDSLLEIQEYAGANGLSISNSYFNCNQSYSNYDCVNINLPSYAVNIENTEFIVDGGLASIFSLNTSNFESDNVTFEGFGSEVSGYVASYSPLNVSGRICDGGMGYVMFGVGGDESAFISSDGESIADSLIDGSENISAFCLDLSGFGADDNATFYFASDIDCSFIEGMGITCYGEVPDVFISNGAGNDFTFNPAAFNSTVNITNTGTYPAYVNSAGSIISGGIEIYGANNEFSNTNFSNSYIVDQSGLGAYNIIEYGEKQPRWPWLVWEENNLTGFYNISREDDFNFAENFVEYTTYNGASVLNNSFPSLVVDELMFGPSNLQVCENNSGVLENCVSCIVENDCEYLDSEVVYDGLSSLGNYSINGSIANLNVSVALITPDTDGNFSQNNFNTFSINVTCSGNNDCGIVNASLFFENVTDSTEEFSFYSVDQTTFLSRYGSSGESVFYESDYNKSFSSISEGGDYVYLASTEDDIYQYDRNTGALTNNWDNVDIEWDIGWATEIVADNESNFYYSRIASEVIAKRNSSGALQWLYSFDPSASQSVEGIELGGNGKLFLYGTENLTILTDLNLGAPTFYANLTYEGETIKAVSAAHDEGYFFVVTKDDTNGNFSFYQYADDDGMVWEGNELVGTLSFSPVDQNISSDSDALLAADMTAWAYPLAIFKNKDDSNAYNFLSFEWNFASVWANNKVRPGNISENYSNYVLTVEKTGNDPITTVGATSTEGNGKIIIHNYNAQYEREYNYTGTIVSLVSFDVLDLDSGVSYTNGTVPINSGDVFYANTSGFTQTSSLVVGESETVTWYVNATGTLLESYLMFAQVQLNNDISLIEETNVVNITIASESSFEEGGAPEEPAGEYGFSSNSSFEFDIISEANEETIIPQIPDLDGDTPLNYTVNWDDGVYTFRFVGDSENNILQVFVNNSDSSNKLYFIDWDNNISTGCISAGEGTCDPLLNGSDVLVGYWDTFNGPFIVCWNETLGGWYNFTGGEGHEQCVAGLETFSLYWNNGGNAFEFMLDSAESWNDKQLYSYDSEFNIEYTLVTATSGGFSYPVIYSDPYGFLESFTYGINESFFYDGFGQESFDYDWVEDGYIHMNGTHTNSSGDFVVLYDYYENISSTGFYSTVNVSLILTNDTLSTNVNMFSGLNLYHPLEGAPFPFCGFVFDESGQYSLLLFDGITTNSTVLPCVGCSNYTDTVNLTYASETGFVCSADSYSVSLPSNPAINDSFSIGIMSTLFGVGGVGPANGTLDAYFDDFLYYSDSNDAGMNDSTYLETFVDDFSPVLNVTFYDIDVGDTVESFFSADYLFGVWNLTQESESYVDIATLDYLETDTDFEAAVYANLFPEIGSFEDDAYLISVLQAYSEADDDLFFACELGYNLSGYYFKGVSNTDETNLPISGVASSGFINLSFDSELNQSTCVYDGNTITFNATVGTDHVLVLGLGLGRDDDWNNVTGTGNVSFDDLTFTVSSGDELTSFFDDFSSIFDNEFYMLESSLGLSIATSPALFVEGNVFQNSNPSLDITVNDYLPVENFSLSADINLEPVTEMLEGDAYLMSGLVVINKFDESVYGCILFANSTGYYFAGMNGELGVVDVTSGVLSYGSLIYDYDSSNNMSICSYGEDLIMFELPLVSDVFQIVLPLHLDSDLNNSNMTAQGNITMDNLNYTLTADLEGQGEAEPAKTIAGYLTGYAYADDTGEIIPNVSISVFGYDNWGDTLNETIGQANGSGYFNVSVYDYSEVQVVFSKSDSEGIATYVSSSLDFIPSDFLLNFTEGVDLKMQLKPAITFNLSVVNESGDPITFQYNVRELEYNKWVSESGAAVISDEVILPADKNYTFVIYPTQENPVTVTFDNISSYVEPDYITHQINATSDYRRVSGNINNFGPAYENMSIIVYDAEGGKHIYSGATFNQNMAYYEMGWDDTFDELTGEFNVSVPANLNLALFATVHNGSEYVGGFKIISKGTSNLTDVVIPMLPLGGAEGNIQLVSPSGFVNVTTKLVTFNLTDASNESIEGSVQIYADLALLGVSDGMEFSVGHDQYTGNLVMPLLSSIYNVEVFSNAGASLFARLDGSDLFSNPVHLALPDIGSKDRDGNVLTTTLDLFEYNSTCLNYKELSNECVLVSDMSLDSEPPELGQAMFEGKKITALFENPSFKVTYLGVDLETSQPPETEGLAEAVETEFGPEALELAWQFGSSGAVNYDCLMVGIPYNESEIDEFGTFNMKLHTLYDHDWNEVWNQTAGGTIGTLPEYYEDYVTTTDWCGEPMDYTPLFTSIGTNCSTKITNDSALCSVDKKNNVVWLRLLHFSGMDPEIVVTTLDDDIVTGMVKDGVEVEFEDEFNFTHIAAQIFADSAGVANPTSVDDFFEAVDDDVRRTIFRLKPDMEDYAEPYVGNLNSILIFNITLEEAEEADYCKLMYHRDGAIKSVCLTDKLNFSDPEFAIFDLEELTARFKPLGFSGYSYGSNANLTINDTEEVETVFTGEPATFYAYYVNKTSGSLITGGSCNVTITDMVTDAVMTESDSYYYYANASGFSSADTYDWNVTCDHADYDNLFTNDTITIVSAGGAQVPEFSDYAIMLLLALTVGGFVIIRRKDE